MNAENKIPSECLTAPRVTLDEIEANIAYETYFTAADAAAAVDLDPGPASLSLLTICVLVLANGYTVTGESACVSIENFNADLGRKIAREKAIDKIWPLMGYALRDRLSDSSAERVSTKGIQVGDVVGLKSGGSKMTVEKVIAEKNLVGCVWFDIENNGPYRANFACDALVKVG